MLLVLTDLDIQIDGSHWLQANIVSSGSQSANFYLWWNSWKYWSDLLVALRLWQAESAKNVFTPDISRSNSPFLNTIRYTFTARSQGVLYLRPLWIKKSCIHCPTLKSEFKVQVRNFQKYAITDDISRYSNLTFWRPRSLNFPIQVFFHSLDLVNGSSPKWCLICSLITYPVCRNCKKGEQCYCLVDFQTLVFLSVEIFYQLPYRHLFIIKIVRSFVVLAISIYKNSIWQQHKGV